MKDQTKVPWGEARKMKWDEAVDFVLQGGILAYPTDTLWGLGCRADNAELCHKCLKLKGESRQQVASVVVSDAMLNHLVQVPSEVHDFFPGPFTLVLPAIQDKLKHLQSGDGFLGCRMPRHQSLLRFVERLGFPLVTTSLNTSGTPPCRSFEEAELVAMNWNLGIIQENATLEGASTVLKWDGQVWKVLRQGQGKLPEWLKST